MAEQKRRFENVVTVTGVVKDFEVNEIVKSGKAPMKSLRMQVETSEGEVHRVDKFAMEYYEKDGVRTENKAYKAIQTIQDEYTTLKDVSEGKAETATVVKVRGSLSNNMYKNKGGQLVINNQIDAMFINRLDTYDEADFGATFTLQGFVTSKGVRVLDTQGEETDEAKISIATIDYRGTGHVFEFVANNEYGVADWLEEDSEMGMTLIIQGKLINKYLVKQVERQNNGIGKPIVDTKREINRKNLIEGISVIEDEDSIEFITPKEQQEALKKHEQEKVEVESTTPKKKQATSVGVQKGVTSTKKTPVSKTLQGVSEDDLPF